LAVRPSSAAIKLAASFLALAASFVGLFLVAESLAAPACFSSLTDLAVNWPEAVLSPF
jgi:hypothetical protein